MVPQFQNTTLPALTTLPYFTVESGLGFVMKSVAGNNTGYCNFTWMANTATTYYSVFNSSCYSNLTAANSAVNSTATLAQM
jgi:hypothetical protein